MKVSLVHKNTFMKTTNPNTGTPGLSSILATESAPKAANKTTVKPTPSTKTTAASAKSTPPGKTPTAVIKKDVSEAKAAPTRNTTSSFNVAGTKYNIVKDNNNTRNLIQWDDQGNVSPTSPVQIVGKDISGGFILAASDSVPNASKQQFPYSKDKGIHFSSLESDKSGDVSRMQKIHSQSFDDFSDIADQNAASQLRGIYKRTGRF